MKKLLYSIMALAAVVATSCTQEHIEAQFIPGNVVAPVLGAIEGVTLAEDGENITVEYTKADFGVATATAEALYIDLVETMENKTKVNATFADGVITFSQKDLNTAMLNLSADTGVASTVYFRIDANLNTDKGAAVSGTESYSNVVAADFTAYNAEVLPTEKYDHVWVIGKYCDWDHGKTQFLFDYTASGTTYSGVVDFANADGVSLANEGFKLTGIAGWQDDCNWGEEVKAESADEPASIQLIAGGGSQDIMRYAMRFYGFEFDKTSLELKKVWGANQIGIIGLNGDWDNDIVMEYNPKWTRFYADIEATADTEIKFRADADWTLNWGADCANGGDNIPVKAGKYRVYFNPAMGFIEFNVKNYGTVEDTQATAPEEPENPDTPAVTKESGKWGLIGVAGDWENDIYMYAGDAGLFYSPVVSFEGEFKLRFNNDWVINRGGALAAVGEAFDAVAGGDNIKVEAGTYVVVYDSVNDKITVENAAQGWGLIGDALANGWDADTYKAFEGEAGVYTAIIFAGEGGFKFRANADWTDNFGGTFTAFGEPFEAKAGGDNISLGAEAGKWVVVTLDTNASTITVNKLFAGRWGVVGQVSGSNWDADVLMWNDGSVWKSVPFVADGEFKIRKDADWAENFGGAFVALDTAFAAEAGGANINLNGAATCVTLVYDPTAATITVSEFK